MTFLVHRGDWPVPQGLRRGARLVPPAPLARLDTRWSTLTLPIRAQVAKEEALLSYRSQTAVMKRFLTSFVRRNELFGVLPPEELTESLAAGWGSRPAAAGVAFRESHLEHLNTRRPEHLDSPWQVAIADTTRDTLIRGIEGSGDISMVEAGLVADRLWLRVTTRRPLSPRLVYTIRLHPLGRGAEQARPLTMPFYRLRCTEPGVTGDADGDDLEVSVPLSRLCHPTALLFGADSRLGRVPIDRVCWRLLRLPPVLQPFGPHL